MQKLAPACLLLIGLSSIRCNVGVADGDGNMGGTGPLGGATGSGGADGSGGSGGTIDDCPDQICCIARESYCKGDEIWVRPLDPACMDEPAFGEECPYGCAASTLYGFAYCEDAPEGGAGGLGGEGGLDAGQP